MSRVLLSAGDVSGDGHAAALVQALLARAEDAGLPVEIRALGGPRTHAAGARLAADTSGVSSVGIVESLPVLQRAWRLRRRVHRLLRRWRPHVAVLMDYPGINIPLAQRLSRAGVPVIYYIPPEEWLWTTRGNRLLDRTNRLVRAVTRVLAVHPVEAEFYTSVGCEVVLVGHPLVDQVAAQPVHRAAARARLGLSADARVVTLLPASRAQELRLVWPLLAESAALLRRQDPRLQFLLPAASPALTVPLRAAMARIEQRFPALGGALRLVEWGDEPPSALAIAAADLALSKSGSVTVEVALRGVPQVAVYRLGAGSLWVARHLLRLTEADIANFVLVNHVLGRRVVPELLYRATPQAVAAAAMPLLAEDSPERAAQLRGYAELRERLGPPGAAERAAAEVWRCLLEAAPDRAGSHGA